MEVFAATLRAVCVEWRDSNRLRLSCLFAGIMSAVPEPATAPNPAKTDTPAPATASADPTGKPGDLILARVRPVRCIADKTATCLCYIGPQPVARE